MSATSTPDRALVRGVPTTFERCVRAEPDETDPVDLPLARDQHRSYCETLQSLGLELIRVERDDRFPDSCFVEDPALVIGDVAVIARMGIRSRTGEEVAIREALRPLKRIRQIVRPGTLEGGDVIQIDEKAYVGLSGRTNRAGLEQLEAMVSDLGFQVIPVEVHRGLHLKSSCTYIGDGTVVAVRGHFDERPFSDYRMIDIQPDEAPAADSLRVRDRVLVVEEYPEARKRIEAEGFDTLPLSMSEVEKCDGALTCLSIVF